MEVIIAIMMYLGVIASPDEYQEEMEEKYDEKIEHVKSDEELMEEEVDPIVESIDDREQ